MCWEPTWTRHKSQLQHSKKHFSETESPKVAFRQTNQKLCFLSSEQSDSCLAKSCRTALSKHPSHLEACPKEQHIVSEWTELHVLILQILEIGAVLKGETMGDRKMQV